jgi:hypothetical protein
LPAEQRASRDRLLHLADDGLSVRGTALALRQPQTAPDHGEKVIDVVDDERRQVRYRPHLARPPAATAPRVSDRRAGVAQSSRDLAVGPGERDFQVPGRHEAATAIAHATRPCAERTRHSKRDAGVVHEHDDILRRRAFDRAGG